MQEGCFSLSLSLALLTFSCNTAFASKKVVGLNLYLPHKNVGGEFVPNMLKYDGVYFMVDSNTGPLELYGLKFYVCSGDGLDGGLVPYDVGMVLRQAYEAESDDETLKLDVCSYDVATGKISAPSGANMPTAELSIYEYGVEGRTCISFKPDEIFGAKSLVSLDNDPNVAVFALKPNFNVKSSYNIQPSDSSWSIENVEINNAASNKNTLPVKLVKSGDEYSIYSANQLNLMACDYNGSNVRPFAPVWPAKAEQGRYNVGGGPGSEIWKDCYRVELYSGRMKIIDGVGTDRTTEFTFRINGGFQRDWSDFSLPAFFYGDQSYSDGSGLHAHFVSNSLLVEDIKDYGKLKFSLYAGEGAHHGAPAIAIGNVQPGADNMPRWLTYKPIDVIAYVLPDGTVTSVEPTSKPASTPVTPVLSMADDKSVTTSGSNLTFKLKAASVPADAFANYEANITLDGKNFATGTGSAVTLANEFSVTVPALTAADGTVVGTVTVILKPKTASDAQHTYNSSNSLTVTLKGSKPTTSGGTTIPGGYTLSDQAQTPDDPDTDGSSSSGGGGNPSGGTSAIISKGELTLSPDLTFSGKITGSSKTEGFVDVTLVDDDFEFCIDGHDAKAINKELSDTTFVAGKLGATSVSGALKLFGDNAIDVTAIKTAAANTLDLNNLDGDCLISYADLKEAISVRVCEDYESMYGYGSSTYASFDRENLSASTDVVVTAGKDDEHVHIKVTTEMPLMVGGEFITLNGDTLRCEPYTTINAMVNSKKQLKYFDEALTLAVINHGDGDELYYRAYKPELSSSDITPPTENNGNIEFNVWVKTPHHNVSEANDSLCALKDYIAKVSGITDATVTYNGKRNHNMVKISVPKLADGAVGTMSLRLDPTVESCDYEDSTFQNFVYVLASADELKLWVRNDTVSAQALDPVAKVKTEVTPVLSLVGSKGVVAGADGLTFHVKAESNTGPQFFLNAYTTDCDLDEENFADYAIQVTSETDPELYGFVVKVPDLKATDGTVVGTFTISLGVNNTNDPNYTYNPSNELKVYLKGSADGYIISEAILTPDSDGDLTPDKDSGSTTPGTSPKPADPVNPDPGSGSTGESGGSSGSGDGDSTGGNGNAQTGNEENTGETGGGQSSESGQAPSTGTGTGSGSQEFNDQQAAGDKIAEDLGLDDGETPEFSNPGNVDKNTPVSHMTVNVDASNLPDGVTVVEFVESIEAKVLESVRKVVDAAISREFQDVAYSAPGFITASTEAGDESHQSVISVKAKINLRKGEILKGDERLKLRMAIQTGEGVKVLNYSSGWTWNDVRNMPAGLFTALLKDDKPKGNGKGNGKAKSMASIAVDELDRFIEAEYEIVTNTLDVADTISEAEVKSGKPIPSNKITVLAVDDKTGDAEPVARTVFSQITKNAAGKNSQTPENSSTDGGSGGGCEVNPFRF